MRRLTGLLLCGAILAAGCAGQSPKSPTQVMDVSASMKQAGLAVEAAAPPAKKEAGEKAQPRKIIYTGRVELVVEDFDPAATQLADLLAEHDGYVAHSDVTGRPGEPRHGLWTVRVPVARFDSFRKAISTLGELRKSTLESDDVTDRYFDMAAETANLEAREKALRKLYDDKIAGSKLTDLLDVDRELSKVRGEINTRKGQLQRWDKESAFATLHVQMQDRKSYVPTTSPDFGTSVGRTFWGSVDALVAAGKGLVLFAVAVAPWAAVLAVVASPVLMLLWRRRPGSPPEPGS
jgi:hypothetical protein